jgi:hypothetical protein
VLIGGLTSVFVALELSPDRRIQPRCPINLSLAVRMQPRRQHVSEGLAFVTRVVVSESKEQLVSLAVPDFVN